ncbi:MAG: glycosyltransferase family 4 protein [Flavobacteriaceae bacterium]|nr:glycosyltransferase family 4 protein [Flavobacteriaceae bacterium]
MVNVLYIGNQLQHKHGIPTIIDSLSKLLSNEGFCVFTASKKQNKAKRIIDMCWQVVKHRSKVDVVLIDTYSTQNFWYALIVSQLCRILQLQYIPVLHGGNLPFRLKHNPILSRLIFKYAYMLVSPSLFLKEHFKSYGYNAEYIPNNLELEKYPFRKRVINKIKLLWVRSFSEIYNPKMAVDVAKQLRDKGIEFELCMIGPEKDGTLEQTKSYAIASNVEVKFTGGLPKQEWIEASKAYNIFINTTNFDNMPVSVIEAMALGLPIVSTNVGGLSYLLDDNDTALLVEKDDVQNMVDAIISLKTNRELYEKLVYNGRSKAEDFDWKKIRLQWENVLISTLKIQE